LFKIFKYLKIKISDTIKTMLYLNMLFCIAVFLLAAMTTVSGSPVKCIVTAPYIKTQTNVILSVDKAVREAQAWYEYQLEYAMENPQDIDAAVDRFMEVYCKEPYFKGFVGITGTEELFTNRSEVRELYKGAILGVGIGATFNVKFHNTIIEIHPEDQIEKHSSVYANITAFNEHVIRVPGANNTMDLNIVLGHYRNQWRIDEDGNVCLSRFHDSFLKIFRLEYTSVLSIPWNLNI
jgi:hypothetical protein